MKRNLVLLSGGLKSSYLVSLAKREAETYGVFFNYGQHHCAHERRSARLVADFYNINLIEKTIGDLTCQDPLLRLLNFFLQAIDILKECPGNIIYHGITKENLLPHSLVEVEAFIKQFQGLFELGQLPYHGEQWIGRAECETPLRKLYLPQVLRLSKAWSVPWWMTWSCVNPQVGKQHCGECVKCQRRLTAFRLIGEEDEISYTRKEVSNDQAIRTN